MMNILISKLGTKLNDECYPLPWSYDGTCFNFREPDTLVCDNELETIEAPLDIQTLVIRSDLKDYSFIAEMKNLKQLYIYKGKRVKDLRFLEDLVKLSQILVAYSKVTSVESINKLFENKKKAVEQGKLNRLDSGVDGIYIHSSKAGIKDEKIDRRGIYLGDLFLIVS